MSRPRDYLDEKMEETDSLSDFLLGFLFTPVSLILECLATIVAVIPFIIIRFVDSVIIDYLIIAISIIVLFVIIFYMYKRYKKTRVSHHSKIHTQKHSMEGAIIENPYDPVLGISKRKVREIKHSQTLTSVDMKENLPKHINFTDVNIIEDILENNESIKIEELCVKCGLDEETTLEIAIDILGRKRYFDEILSREYFNEMTGRKN